MDNYRYGESEGRLDRDGNVWYACDPYPTWYRWENGELLTPDFGFAGSPGQYSEKGTFPGWADEE